MAQSFQLDQVCLSIDTHPGCKIGILDNPVAKYSRLDCSAKVTLLAPESLNVAVDHLARGRRRLQPEGTLALAANNQSPTNQIFSGMANSNATDIAACAKSRLRGQLRPIPSFV
nr:hypothetical protein [Bifidobacterium asteroides]